MPKGGVQYDPARCGHAVASDHIIGRTTEGQAIWRCASCGAEGPWAEGWRYYGTVECKRCWRPIVERVQCETCADKQERTRQALRGGPRLHAHES